MPYSSAVMDTIRHNYEYFRLKTLDHIHLGLYSDKTKIYAVIDTTEEQLNSLQDIYNTWCTAAIPPAIVTNKIGEDFEKINLRDTYEKTNYFGQPINIIEFYNILSRHIPKEFHPFNADMKWGTNLFTLTFTKELTEENKKEIELICNSLGYQGYQYVFLIDDEIKEFSAKTTIEPNTPNNLLLIPSHHIKKQFSKNIIEKYEEDEDFWTQNKHNIFSGKSNLIDHILPNSFLTNRSRCFIDASVFTRQNLRIYLSIYEQAIIALPFKKGDETDFYKMFKVNKKELQELILRGRLLFVIPQNLHRYPKDILTEITSIDPNCIIFPRRLATSTIIGIQKKAGFLSTTFASDDQYDFLRNCYKSKNKSLIDLANALANQWSFNEFIIDMNGPISTNHIGLSSIAIEMYKRQGKDFTIELSSASRSFEYAQGLNAHHLPYDSPSYSDIPACNIISGLYNGVHAQNNFLQESKLESLLQGILTIDNDMNILELDDILSENSIRKIPSILHKFSNLTSEEVESKLYKLRKDLLKIEKKSENLSKLDFAGFLPMVAGVAMEYSGVKGGAYVALAGWILKALTIQAKSQLEGNPIYTKLQSAIHNVPNETIIIKSYRDSIRKLNNI